MESKTVAATPVDRSHIALPRVLGLWDIVGLVIGGVIGSGIFLVPKDIAFGVKAPILIFAVWVVGGLLSYFGAVTFAEMGAAMPQAGGMYIFLREAYGPLISFLFGWTLFLVIDSGTIATLAVAFSSNYLPYLVPLNPFGQKVVAALFILFLVMVNYVGVRWGANLQNFLTVIKFVALTGICVVIFIFAKGSAGHFVAPPPAHMSWPLIGSFGIALVACLWAYKGWESATFSAGETKKPEKNLPLGIFIGILVCIFLYIVANMAYLFAMPAAEIASSKTIAADAMSKAIGPLAGSIIAFIILFSIMGAANQTVLCSPRVYFAMARDGLFFKRIAEAHPKFLTPHLSIIALGVWALILTLFFKTFERLFEYVVFGEWIFFGLTAAAVIILRKKRPDLPRPYKTLGYPVTPIFFILGAVFVAMSLLITAFKDNIMGLVIILTGVPAYLLFQRGQEARLRKM